MIIAQSLFFGSTLSVIGLSFLKMFRLVISTLYFLLCSTSFAQVNIWENNSCSKKVELTPFLVSGSNNPAIIESLNHGDGSPDHFDRTIE
jgi:hypothetical protein